MNNTNNTDNTDNTDNNKLNINYNNINLEQELITQLKIFTHDKKFALAILTPCYGGLCHSTYTLSLINTIRLFESCNFSIKLYFLNNDSLVSRARNNLIGLAMLDQSITHFIFIDSDIVWNPYDIIKLILSDKSIIGGVYPKKNYKFDKIILNPSTITEWIMNKNKIAPNISDHTIVKNNLLEYNLNYLSPNVQINNNIIEVKHLATGFMLIKREVIELMIQKFPETKYTDDTGFIKPENSIYTFALFDCGVIENSYYSEDWLFCHRWRSLGGNIYVDISIDLEHIGTETFQGSLIRNLLTNSSLN